MGRRSFAGYACEESLSTGLFGECFRAKNKAGKEARVLVVDAELAKRKRFASALARHGTKLSNLVHPHLVTTQTVGRGKDGSLVVIASPVAEPVELLALLERGGGEIPQDVALSIAIGALQGLSHAHEHNVTHGGVHPRSVILNGKGITKLADLGVARALAAAAVAAEDAGLLRGLRGYVAPELALGKEPDVESDVFAIGALICQLLWQTGTPPEDSKGALADALRQATNTEIGKRFANAGVFEKELRRAISDGDIDVAVATRVCDFIANGEPPRPDSVLDSDTEDLLNSLVLGGEPEPPRQSTALEEVLANIGAEEDSSPGTPVPEPIKKRARTSPPIDDDDDDPTQVEIPDYDEDPTNVENRDRMDPADAVEAMLRATTPPPARRSSNPAPVARASTPAPVARASTPAPVARASTPAPVARASTPAPLARASTPAPVARASTPAPVDEPVVRASTPSPADIDPFKRARSVHRAALQDYEVPDDTPLPIPRPFHADGTHLNDLVDLVGRQAATSSPFDDAEDLPEEEVKRSNTLRNLAVIAFVSAALVAVAYTKTDLFERSKKESEARQAEAMAKAEKMQPVPGEITVLSKTEDAAVWLLLGRTPMSSFILPSSMIHELRVEHEGYEPVFVSVANEHWSGEDDERRAKVSMSLARASADKEASLPAFPPIADPPLTPGGAGQGMLVVESTPAGAEVWLLVGSTPIMNLVGIEAGKDYSFKVLKDGYRPASASFKAADWYLTGTSGPVKPGLVQQLALEELPKASEAGSPLPSPPEKDEATEGSKDTDKSPPAKKARSRRKKRR